MVQSGNKLGYVFTPTSKLTPHSFYDKMEVCVYPPSTAENVTFYSGFPLDYEYESD